MCTTHGDTQNRSGGWSTSLTSQDTSPPFIVRRTKSLVKRPVSDGPPWRGGGGGLVSRLYPPIPHRAGYDGGSEGNPLLSPPHIPVTAPTAAGSYDTCPLPLHNLTGLSVYRHSSRVVSGLTHHAHHLEDVCINNNTVKEFHKDVKILLEVERLNPSDYGGGGGTYRKSLQQWVR